MYSALGDFNKPKLAEMDVELGNHKMIRIISLTVVLLSVISGTFIFIPESSVTQGLWQSGLFSLMFRTFEATLDKTMTEHPKSIAVLPFVNMSSDPENEYFSDGISEEILNALTKIDGLMVTARMSSFAFKGKQEDIRNIGRQLGVATILEGSVRKSGDKVRITGQLVNVEGGYHFWSKTWDRNLDDIFAVQDEIALEIAENLRENLGHFFIGEHLVNSSTNNLEAYNLYLQGKFHLNKWSFEDAQEAIQLFLKAIEIEPNFALPYSGLSGCYAFIGAFGFMLPSEVFPMARSFAEKALKIDDQLSEAHMGLGLVSLWGDWDLQATYMHLDRAIELNNSNAAAHQFMALTFMADQKIPEAEKEIGTALMLDPMSVQAHFWHAALYRTQRKYDESLLLLDKALSIDPYFQPASITKGFVLASLKRYDESLALFEHIPIGVGKTIHFIGGLGVVYAMMGETDKAMVYYEQLCEQMQTDQVTLAGEFASLINTKLGRLDEAFEILEWGVRLRAGGLICIKGDPFWEELWEDSRYEKLISSIRGDIVIEEKEVEVHYGKSGLQTNEAKKILKKLEICMQKDKPYRENKLSLRELSAHIGVSGNHLSQVLNEQIEKNFYDYVNGYRLEEFKALVKDPKNQQFTLLSLAYQCGFNSKTTFNTFFKKATGQTPSEYFKKVS